MPPTIPQTEITVDLTKVLPDILYVVEASVIVPTEDLDEAFMVFSGVRYFFSVEFARHRPALALLYDLKLHIVDIERGSARYRVKILPKLRKRVKHGLQRIDRGEAIGLIAAILALPGAINETTTLFERIGKAAASHSERYYPSCTPTVEIEGIRPPDNRDIFPKGATDLTIEDDKA